MVRIADSSVNIQTTLESTPSTPSWFGEVVLISSYLRKHALLSKINEQVRFARKRFGRYEVIDFLAVLFGVPDIVAKVVGLAILSQHTSQRGAVFS